MIQSKKKHFGSSEIISYVMKFPVASLSDMFVFGMFLKIKSVLMFILLVVLSYLLFPLGVDDSVIGKCLQNEFLLKGMRSCHPLLSCQDFIDVRIGKLIGIGAVKAVYHAKWKEYDVALSVLNNPAYENDFFTGAENIRMFQHNPLTIQAVGFCDDEKMFLTELHKNGDASKLMETLKEHPEVNDNSFLRINLCYVYSLILVSLHNPGHFTKGNPSRLPRVMCDTNDLKKLLSQFLVTNDFSLVLNDMDAIPLVKNGGIKCGHQELKGDFVAPEQLWKLPGNFSDIKMPGYDEKTDIWKAPSVCNYFLSNVSDGNEIKKKLTSVHKRCKSLVPKDRPTAGDLAEAYMAIKATLHNITTNK